MFGLGQNGWGTSNSQGVFLLSPPGPRAGFMQALSHNRQYRRRAQSSIVEDKVEWLETNIYQLGSAMQL